MNSKGESTDKEIGVHNPGFKDVDGVHNPGFQEHDEVDYSNLKKRNTFNETREQEYSIEHETETGFQKKEMNGTYIGVKIQNFWKFLGSTIKENKQIIKYSVLLLLFILYNIYFIYAIYYQTVYQQLTLDWCDDVGFLVIINIIVYTGLIYFKLVKPYFPRSVVRDISKSYGIVREKTPDVLLYLVVPLAIGIFVVVDCWTEPSRLYSGLGLLVLLLLGFIFSKHPGYVVWRHVIWGILLQFIFGVLILRWQYGANIFKCLGDKVSTFLAYTDDGSGFVFGYLVNQQPFATFPGNDSSEQTIEIMKEINASKRMNFVFMFKVLSIIYFFNFMVSMLFYVGTMQWIVVKLGWLLQITVGTTACESLNAAANIFLGQSEAPLMIKPYLPDMTKSEIHAVMTGGFATIAGSVLAAYISFGISASHLLTASVMSAPAALAFAKLFYPETRISKTTSESLTPPPSDSANLLDAAATGAMEAVFLVGNIAASLVSVLAFVSFLNGMLSWFGALVGAPYINFQYLLSILFYPLSILMGVQCEPVAECCELGTCPDGFICNQCSAVAELIGLKTIVNEFVAYDKLIEFTNGGVLSARNQAISTFALCGFSNPASMGIQIAALSYMAPSRKGDISAVAFRAFIAGSSACFLTACVAGLLIPVDTDYSSIYPISLNKSVKSIQRKIF